MNAVHLLLDDVVVRLCLNKNWDLLSKIPASNFWFGVTSG